MCTDQFQTSICLSQALVIIVLLPVDFYCLSVTGLFHLTWYSGVPSLIANDSISLRFIMEYSSIVIHIYSTSAPCEMIPSLHKC